MGALFARIATEFFEFSDTFRAHFGLPGETQRRAKKIADLNGDGGPTSASFSASDPIAAKPP